MTARRLLLICSFALLGACDGDPACPGDLVACGDVCVDLSSDDAHCGACDTACGAGACADGTCASTCEPTEISCGARCCPGALGCDPSGLGCAAPPDSGTMDAFVPPPPCPAEAPAEGASCAAIGQRCTYVLCPESVTRAECDRPGWLITSLPCDDYECDRGDPGAATCSGDQLCVSRMGGAFLLECADNPCGAGPVVEDCACEVCGPTDACSVVGTSVTCTADCGGMPCP